MPETNPFILFSLLYRSITGISEWQAQLGAAVPFGCPKGGVGAAGAHALPRCLGWLFGYPGVFQKYRHFDALEV